MLHFSCKLTCCVVSFVVELIFNCCPQKDTFSARDLNSKDATRCFFSFFASLHVLGISYTRPADGPGAVSKCSRCEIHQFKNCKYTSTNIQFIKYMLVLAYDFHWVLLTFQKLAPVQVMSNFLLLCGQAHKLGLRRRGSFPTGWESYTQALLREKKGGGGETLRHQSRKQTEKNSGFSKSQICNDLCTGG